MRGKNGEETDDWNFNKIGGRSTGLRPHVSILRFPEERRRCSVQGDDIDEKLRLALDQLDFDRVDVDHGDYNICSEDLLELELQGMDVGDGDRE